LNLLERLIRRLTLELSSTDTYIGGAGTGGVTENARLFGGLVAAQAAVAAMNTVDEFPIHSLHAYFLRPGRPDQNITFHVSRAKQGRNFAVRNVAAEQHGELIFQLQASFQKITPGVNHQPKAPDVPTPSKLPNRDQLRGRSNWQDMPVDVRMITPITSNQATTPEQQLWLGVNGPLPADPRLHTALVIYASDRCLLDTAWRPHADQGQLTGASLDHSMWFHAIPDFNDWLLYSTHSPAAAGGRGLALGQIFDRKGQHIVSVAQEGVLRSR
jgi:acyl-CoA thioesterase II